MRHQAFLFTLLIKHVFVSANVFQLEVEYGQIEQT